MRLRLTLRAAARSAAKISVKFSPSEIFRRSYSQHHPQSERPSFGIAFDIDGVILRGRSPIGGSPQALRRLYGDDGTLKIPFLFLTNGGGVPESKRARELSELLGVHISPLQVVQGHSPFKELLNRFEDELIVAVGKGVPATVMLEYGFKKVLSIDEYASYFSDIDPLSPYKQWQTKQMFDTMYNSKEVSLRYNIYSDRVKGVFVVSDPVDWGRDIQVLCDILKTGGLPGKEKGHQPPLYFASDDLEYQYTSFGKPNPFAFKNAEAILSNLVDNLYPCQEFAMEGRGHTFTTLYMIGDNPMVDINGAMKAGRPWFSILTRTGVFKGKDNDTQFPADLVVDTVEEAIAHILRKECSTSSSIF